MVGDLYFQTNVGRGGGFLVLHTYIVEDFVTMDDAKDHDVPGGGEEEEGSSSSTVDAVCQSTSKEVDDVTSATSAPAGAIRPIDRGVVHQICSGQVCYDLGGALLIHYWPRLSSL